jgi:Tol biopolymer transport system component
MTKRPISINDLKNVHWISDPQFSPQGNQILYVQKQASQIDKTKYTTQIWVVSAKSEPKLLTGENTSNATPCWSPCGNTIAFVSPRSGSNQIWLLPSNGGEATQLTKFKRPLNLIDWSPDGSKLLASCKCKTQDFSPESKETSDVRVITKLRYKLNGAGFHDDRYTHLFVVDAKTGETKQITHGEFDHVSATWSPCGKKVLFAAKRYEDADYVQHNDLYTVDLDQGSIEQMTSVEGQYSSPTYSPDGQ